jgi:hypothetical protein
VAPESEKQRVSVLQGYYSAEYMGGHAEYPTQTLTDIMIYDDKIEIGALGLEIPYATMVNIENIVKEKISAGRVVGLGLILPELAIVGALWKKNQRYTVIQYHDGTDTQSIIIDFGEYIDDVQPLIYRRMIRFKQSGKPLKQSRKVLRSLEGFSIYENTKYGIIIQYPSNWVEDERDQEHEQFITIVQFREELKNKPPYVTIYANKLPDAKVSLQDFVTKEINELKRESTDVKSIEPILTDIDGNPACQCTYEDNSSFTDYKQMVIWTKKEDIVYEISYSARHDQFSIYFGIIEKMIGSFRFSPNSDVLPSEAQASGSVTEQIGSNSEEQPASNMIDPLHILKRRFALGEINELEYQRNKTNIKKASVGLY